MAQLDLAEELARLEKTNRGQYESTKLALMETSWKHENTNDAENALDKAVDAWVEANYSWAQKVGYGIAVLITLGLVAFAFAFAAWGIRTMVERLS